jgi:hypothetical protein
VSQTLDHDCTDISSGIEPDVIARSLSTKIDISTKNSDIPNGNMDIPLNMFNADVPSWNSSIIDEYYCPNPKNTYNYTNNNDNNNNNNDNILCPRVPSNPLRGSTRVTSAKRLAPTPSQSNLNITNNQNINPIVNITHSHTNTPSENAPYPKRSKQSTIISNTSINSTSKTSTWK